MRRHRAVSGRLSGAGGAQLARGQCVDLLDGVVELPHAGEPGRKGDLGRLQTGGLEQDPGGVRALCPRQCHGTGAQLGIQLPLHLPGAVAEPGRQPGDPFPVDHAIADQPHRPPDDIGAGIPPVSYKMCIRDSWAAAAVGKKATFRRRGVVAGQLGRQ